MPGEGTEPQLCGILAPGNIEGMQEPLDQLFVAGNVCVFKSNPVNARVTDVIFPKGKLLKEVEESFMFNFFFLSNSPSSTC